VKRRTRLELARAYARRANINDLEAMIRNDLPEDAQFLADLARWEATATRNEWRKEKRRQQ